jgi:chorismate mutase
LLNNWENMQIDVNVSKLQDWKIKYKHKFLVAGPCSLESEEQILKTALGLSGSGVNLLRAGIWKPRTRPGTFQGVGIEGLKWLKNAGAAADLPVAVEVATPYHIEQCLKHDIDVLWIGARTTANPFLVQSIADSLRGVDVEIMVKNPINPDIELWIGALERLNLAGLNKLMAIHRGFSVFESTKYQYMPYWEIPILLKKIIPDIPIICDPSHICGNTGLILSVAQEAIDLQFDGLMLEVHINPQKALSDAKQQITPTELFNIINSLKTKQHNIVEV